MEKTGAIIIEGVTVLTATHHDISEPKDFLAEKIADAQDAAMEIADDPELCELYGLEKS